MGIFEDIQSDISTTLNQAWNIRDGQIVPETTDVLLEGGGVRLNATMLYADLADSTELAMWDRRVAARICKAFLAASSRLIRNSGGSVRSFDGDRAMGVFVGDNKNTSAVKCALKINWMFLKVLKPQFDEKYEALGNGTYKLAQCTGVDTSEVLVVRSGIRNNNDLIWVGRAPNAAAKLSAIRDTPYHSFITDDVYKVLAAEAKTTDGKGMWEERKWTNGTVEKVYRSHWTWKP